MQAYTALRFPILDQGFTSDVFGRDMNDPKPEFCTVCFSHKRYRQLLHNPSLRATNVPFIAILSIGSFMRVEELQYAEDDNYKFVTMLGRFKTVSTLEGVERSAVVAVYPEIFPEARETLAFPEPYPEKHREVLPPQGGG